MSSKSLDENALRETFEQFLFEMDQRIEGLQTAAAARGFTLDLTVESLSNLEAFLQEASSISPPSIDLESLIVLGGRYLGEVVREQYGGTWELPLSDRTSVNFNQPVIVGHSATRVEFAPISVVRAFVKKKQPGLLARAVFGQVSPTKLDLSDLVRKENKGGC